MSKVKPKSPLAPLFQRGEYKCGASALPFVNALASLFVNTLASPFDKKGLRDNHGRAIRSLRLAAPFEKEGLRGNRGRAVCILRLASPFEKGGLRGICSCATLRPLNAVLAT